MARLVSYSNFDYIFTNDPDSMVAMFGIDFPRMQELESKFNEALNGYMDNDPEGEKNVAGVVAAFKAIATNPAEEIFAIFRGGCVDGVFSAAYGDTIAGGDNG
jgi:hypothetical protein